MAVLDADVARVEQFEVDGVVVDAGVGERAPKRGLPQVEEPLVALSRVDPDRALRAQRLGVGGGHSHRVPLQPAPPDLGDHGARVGVERQQGRAVGGGREARRHPEDLQQPHVLGLGEGDAGLEVSPPGEDVAVVPAQVARGLEEVRQVLRLRQAVARVGGEGAEQVGAQHRGDHGAQSPARLPRDGAVVPIGQCPIATVHPGHDLLAQVRVVPPGADGVDVLAAAVGRPGVHERQDHRRSLAAGEDPVDQLGNRLAKRGSVAPRRERAAVSQQQVGHGIAAVRLVVAWRQVDPYGTARRVAERVVAQQRAVDELLVEPPVQVE
jgi:hypothetical protein